MKQALATLAAQGTQAELLGRMQTRQELYDLLGYTGYEARDRAYFAGAPAAEVASTRETQTR